MYRIMIRNADDTLPYCLDQFETFVQAEQVAIRHLVRWSDETDADYHMHSDQLTDKVKLYATVAEGNELIELVWIEVTS